MLNRWRHGLEHSRDSSVECMCLLHCHRDDAQHDASHEGAHHGVDDDMQFGEDDEVTEMAVS